MNLFRIAVPSLFICGLVGSFARPAHAVDPITDDIPTRKKVGDLTYIYVRHCAGELGSSYSIDPAIASQASGWERRARECATWEDGVRKCEYDYGLNVTYAGVVSAPTGLVQEGFVQFYLDSAGTVGSCQAPVGEMPKCTHEEFAYTMKYQFVPASSVACP